MANCQECGGQVLPDGEGGHFCVDCHRLVSSRGRAHLPNEHYTVEVGCAKWRDGCIVEQWDTSTIGAGDVDPDNLQETAAAAQVAPDLLQALRRIHRILDPVSGPKDQQHADACLRIVEGALRELRRVSGHGGAR